MSQWGTRPAGSTGGVLPHQPGRRRVLGRMFWVLPLVALAGYAVIVGVGLAVPQSPNGVLWASIVWTILAWAAGGILFHESGRSRFVRWFGLWLTVPALLFLMVGVAEYGPAKAVENRSEVVRVRVVEVAPGTRESYGQHGRERTAWVTYRFAHLDGRPVPGEVTYRGNTQGYGFQRGQVVALRIDPTGQLPIALDSETHSRINVWEIAIGVVLYAAVWGLLCLVQVVRGRRRA